MKKILMIFSFLLCISLTGCGNTEKQVQKDIENQLASIKVGEEDISDFNIYEKMNIKDSKLNIDDLSPTDLNTIFSNMEYTVKDVSVNKSTATATIEIKTKDIDEILSNDETVSLLLLEYNNFISKNPNADRETVDIDLLNYICAIIKADTTFSTNDVIANVYYSADDEKWSIAYDDDFLNCLLGNIEKDYLIDFNDICEEEKENTNISYNYDKILNLPDTNKSTRSSTKNPIAINEEAYFDNSDYFFERERYELKMKLEEVIRGDDAYNLLYNASADNIENLNSDSEYILFKISINLENNLSSNKTVTIDENDFSLLDENGHYYNNCIIFNIDKLQPMEEGTSTEGYICFIIDKNVKPYLLFKDYMDNTLCFSN